MKAVVDIGKTNVKLHILNDDGASFTHYSRKNVPVMSSPYPHADVDGIWQWLIETLAVFADVSQIDAIIVTTHGATAALVTMPDAPNDGAHGLALPILDYEYPAITECNSAYHLVRSSFDETFSPDLPAGLNLGRQLFWQATQYPEAFAKTHAILMYPQYWAWRLGGRLASEVTSLGCHTDLWAPELQGYSSQVDRLQWRELFPPMVNAWDCLGRVSEQVQALTGLPNHCRIHAGLHDSNASYLRYLQPEKDAPFSVISTGTWTIFLEAKGDLTRLKDYRDTLTNSDIYNQAVACARYMGGREYDAICQFLGADTSAEVNETKVQMALDHGWWVTPDFSEGNGPFGGMTPRASKTIPAEAAGVVATLYSALMIDQRLNDLNSTGDIYIEGAFLVNPLLCQLVAQLRAPQQVFLSDDATGTVQGAFSLMNKTSAERKKPVLGAKTHPCVASRFTGLDEYKTQWQSFIAENDCIS